MSSIERSLHGNALLFDLEAEEAEATHPDTLDRDGRSSRTLLKEGALRVTLVVLGPGGGIPEHDAEGPITIQPLRGQVEVATDGGAQRVETGQILALGPRVPHDVRSDEGAAFLLTVSHPA